MTIKDEIIKFVQTELWDIRKGIDLETRLLEDIGIDGDDADEFFQKYSEKFKVDLSEMNWDKHFGSEGLNLLGIFNKSFWEKAESIRIKDLVDSATSHKWIYKYK